MKSVKAIIRPEKVFEVMEKLSDAGFHAVTRMTILGLSLIHISEPTRRS